MTLLSRRSKMVSIRLSDEEFRRLRELCLTTGARSVSDLAREAMRRLTADAPDSTETAGGELTARVEDLDQRVSYLQQQVSRLAMSVGHGER